jgi:anti-sigma B factor antagonist
VPQRLAMKQRTHVVDPTLTSATHNPGLAVTLERRDYEARLAVTGELDLGTYTSLITAAAGVLQPPVRALLLDLGGVTFCGAAGVTSLLTIRQLAADAEIRLVLAGVQRPVRHVLDIVGVSARFPIAHARTSGHGDADGRAVRPAGRPQ